MKPFRFTPLFKSLIWGGEKIAGYKGVATDLHNIGESWELSGVAQNESVVCEGEYAGQTLPELIARFRDELVGRKVYAQHGTEFPLLIKFIDARQDLSIQVHPNDELARARCGKKGKTEMWYVVAADADARLKCGFSKQVTPDEYERCVNEDRITEVLTDYPIGAGDVFFLPAGRIHAIGAGAFIAEIQQTSDITYRIYDYNRPGVDGKPRELHTEQAKAAIDYTVLPDYRTHYDFRRNAEVELVSCPYFVTSLYDLDTPCTKEVAPLDSFVVVICIGGSGAIEDSEGNRTPLRQGQTLLVPASTQAIRMVPDDGGMKLLTSHL